MNNIVILIGRITRNIELKKTPNAISVCNITLAVNRNYKNSEGVYETDFITCTCYRNIAERASMYCKKGDLVGIKGMIQVRDYEKDGKKTYATEIIVDRLNFLSIASKKEEVKEEQVVEEKIEDPYEVFSKENNMEEMELPF